MTSKAKKGAKKDEKKVTRVRTFSVFGDVGLGLRVARTVRRLSQADLADKAGVTQAMLSRYESGADTPKLQSLDALLGALDITLAEFSRLTHQEVERAEERAERSKDQTKEAVVALVRALYHDSDGSGLTVADLQAILAPGRDT